MVSISLHSMPHHAISHDTQSDPNPRRFLWRQLIGRAAVTLPPPTTHCRSHLWTFCSVDVCFASAGVCPFVHVDEYIIAQSHHLSWLAGRLPYWLTLQDFTMAEDQYWHLDHFCCRVCDALLVDQEYVTRDNNVRRLHPRLY